MHPSMHLPVLSDATDDTLEELLTFFGLNHPSTHTVSIDQGTGHAGHDNAYVGPNTLNQTTVYGGITHYNTSGNSLPQDAHGSTTYHQPIPAHTSQYSDSMHGTTSNMIHSGYSNTFNHLDVSNQVVAYGGIVYGNASNIGVHDAYGSAANHGTVGQFLPPNDYGQVLPPCEHGTSDQIFLPYDNTSNVTLGVGVHNAHGGVVNYDISNQVIGYSGIIPSNTPNADIHVPLPPAQYSQHQFGSPGGHGNTPIMDIYEPLPPAQYHQYQFGSLARHDNAYNVDLQVPPASAQYNQFGLLVGADTNSTPPMSSFNQLAVVSVNGVHGPLIAAEPASDPYPANGFGTQVLPSSGNFAPSNDLPVETGDVNSPSSSVELDTASQDVPGTPVSPSTTGSGELDSNTPPTDVPDGSGYSVIHQLQTNFVEDIMLLPLYTPEDRQTWTVRINREGRSAEHHLVRFRRRGDIPNSLWGVPMLDCISPLSRLLLDAEERIDCLGDGGESHILLKILWHGYETIDYVKRLPIRTSDNKIVTRVELARAIAHEFFQFCERCTSGEYEYVSTDPRWEIGTRFTFENISLASIWNPEGDIWIPAFRYLIPRDPVTPT